MSRLTSTNRMSVSFDLVASRVSSIRQQICPRTSYATSGTAATRLTVIQSSSQDTAAYLAFQTSMLKTGEVEQFHSLNTGDIFALDANHGLGHGVGMGVEDISVDAKIGNKSKSAQAEEVKSAVISQVAGVPPEHVTVVALWHPRGTSPQQEEEQQSTPERYLEYHRAYKLAETLIRCEQVPLVVIVADSALVPTDISSLSTSKNSGIGVNVSKALSVAGTSAGDLSNTDASIGYRLISLYCSTQLGISTTATSARVTQEQRPLVGASGQPAVHTRQQFQFLWDQAALKQPAKLSKHNNVVDCGKQRVLQRLADKDVLCTSAAAAATATTAGAVATSATTGEMIRMPTTYWNKLITNMLKKGADDLAIYSMIRKITTGRALEQDLEVRIKEEGEQDLEVRIEEERKEGQAVVAKAAVAAVAAAGELPSQQQAQLQPNTDNVENEEYAEAAVSSAAGKERAGFMVKMIHSCVPEKVKSRIGSVLDYGCAEGAITAALGKAFDLPSTRVYGADVRAIPAEGFTFLHLPAEVPGSPPAAETLLSGIKSSSIHLITCSMVLHHVMHPLAALQELRRVMRPNGCLVLREHHCDSADMGAFLDIIHGLYSLCWSQPVEWPRFVDQYVAWYRPQSMWDSLARAAGFIRVEEDETASGTGAGTGTGAGGDGVNGGVGSHYTVRSHVKHDGTIGNIIKAYYATYVPIVKAGTGPNSESGTTAVHSMAAIASQAAASAATASFGLHVSSNCDIATASVPSTAATTGAAAALGGSLYGGVAPAAVGTGTSTGTGAGANSLYGSGSSLYGSSGTAETDTAEEQPPHKRSRTEEGPSSSASFTPAITSFSAVEVPVELFESRRNRGHFYYTALDSQGKPTQPKWVPVFDLLSNAQVEAIEHPVDVSKVYIHAEHDKHKGRQVKKINYIID